MMAFSSGSPNDSKLRMTCRYRCIILQAYNTAYKHNMIPSERASQEEQNGANFSFIAPSSEELLVRKELLQIP